MARVAANITTQPCIPQVEVYGMDRQAGFRRRVLEARLRVAESPGEAQRWLEALSSQVPLVEVLVPSRAFGW